MFNNIKMWYRDAFPLPPADGGLTQERDDEEYDRMWARDALFVVAILAVVWVVFAIVIPSAAQAQSTEARATVMQNHTTVVRHPHVKRVMMVSARDLWAEFNTGAVVRFTPCRTEDSTDCYWLGFRRGNHRGYSFVNWDGEQWRIRSALLYEANLFPEGTVMGDLTP